MCLCAPPGPRRWPAKRGGRLPPPGPLHAAGPVPCRGPMHRRITWPAWLQRMGRAGPSSGAADACAPARSWQPGPRVCAVYLLPAWGRQQSIVSPRSHPLSSWKWIRATCRSFSRSSGRAGPMPSILGRPPRGMDGDALLRQARGHPVTADNRPASPAVEGCAEAAGATRSAAPPGPQSKGRRTLPAGAPPPAGPPDSEAHCLPLDDARASRSSRVCACHAG